MREHSITSSESAQLIYERRLKALETELLSPSRWGAVYQLATWKGFKDAYNSDGEEIWGYSPMLLPLFLSVQSNMVVAFARIFEDKKRSFGNIFKFLSHAKSNAKDIQWPLENDKGKLQKLDAKIIEEQERKLEAHQDTIKAIMQRRDKYVAHMDADYLEDPDRLDSDNPLEFEQFRNLKNTAIEIVNFHKWGLEKSNLINMANFAELQTSILIDQLRSSKAG